MNAITRIRDFLTNRKAVDRRAGSSWDRLTGPGGLARAGVVVSPAAAENLSSVFGAIQIISETLAVLPLRVFEVRDGRRREITDHPIARLFRDAPNEWQTPMEFIEQQTAMTLLHGNSYAEIERDTTGAPVQLWPISPGNVTVEVIPQSRRRRFRVSDELGTRVLLPYEMFHLRDRTDDGFMGVSRLRRARDAFGSIIAGENYAAATWRNQARPSGVATHPESIGPEAAKTLRESLQSLLRGTDNAAEILVLEEGMTWEAMSISPRDAELLSSRKFSVEEVARLFRIPPPLLGALDNASFSNISELMRSFAAHTIQPWAVRFVQTIHRSLLTSESRRTHMVEFDLMPLTRGDFLSRLQAYRIGREIGLWSANELREMESLNPREDGYADQYFSPQNMNREQTGEPRDPGEGNDAE